MSAVSVPRNSSALEIIPQNLFCSFALILRRYQSQSHLQYARLLLQQGYNRCREPTLFINLRLNHPLRHSRAFLHGSLSHSWALLQGSLITAIRPPIQAVLDVSLLRDKPRPFLRHGDDS